MGMEFDQMKRLVRTGEVPSRGVSWKYRGVFSCSREWR